VTDFRYYTWDGLDGYGRRSILAVEDGVALLGAFQPLVDGHWVQQPADVLHECQIITAKQLLRECPDVDPTAPINGYRTGY